MRIYIYFVRLDSNFYKLLSKKEKKLKKKQFCQIEVNIYILLSITGSHNEKNP